jgi:hypothetical protein
VYAFKSRTESAASPKGSAFSHDKSKGAIGYDARPGQHAAGACRTYLDFQPRGNPVMRKIASLFAALGGLLVLVLHAAPAAAQATRTWVSGVGDDTSPTCSRTAPCKTYAAAFALTSTGGEINCTDPGGFGTLTINMSIRIV